MSNIGPAGERGKTGDHGQHGDAGQTGATGETGETGETGIQGVQGFRGAQGRQGIQGLRGRALTWTQALAMFAMVVLIGLVMAWSVERQQNRLEAQQAELAAAQARIQDNTRKIAEDRYLGCLGGVQIIDKINLKVKTLADIERRNTKDPLAKERVKAYEKALITLPDPACKR